MNTQQHLQKACQLRELEKDDDYRIRNAARYQVGLSQGKVLVDIMKQLGMTGEHLQEIRRHHWGGMRKLDDNQLLRGQADLWYDNNRLVRNLRDEMASQPDPFDFKLSWLKSYGDLCNKWFKEIDTRPKMYLKHAAFKLYSHRPDYPYTWELDPRLKRGPWNEAARSIPLEEPLVKSKVRLMLEYQTQQHSTSEHTQWLEFPLTWAHQVKRLGIPSLENKIVFSAEPCMTTEVHGAVIEGFRAKWYKLDRKLGWTIDEGYIAKCDDMYRTCKSRMHITTVAKRKVAKTVTNELLDALG